MGDRYSRSGRRSPIYDHYGRVSAPNMPTSVGHSSFYGGDIHVLPSRYDNAAAAAATQPHHHHHHHHRHNSNTNSSSNWRGPNVPVTTTTYTVKKDPVTRTSSVREHSRNRSATLDTLSKRPPIIVTTRQSKEPSSSSHASAARDIPMSPAPDRGRGGSAYREEYYAMPASSIRSRSHTRPYASGSISSTLDNEELHRLRQRTNDDRLGPSWGDSRRERPSSMYASNPRHSIATVADVGGESGYEYTTPSDLVRYDLDHDRRPSYARPSVTVSDLDRRPYDSRARGPPPTTRGLDKVNRRVAEDPTAGIYDRPPVRMPVAAIPVPVADRRASQLDPVSAGSIERRPSRNGQRPLSLYQDSSSRSSRVEDYAPSRDPRDRDYYREDDVAGRGFGLRAEPDRRKEFGREDYASNRDRRRDSRIDDRGREPRRHSDEELDRRERRQSRDHGRRDSSLRPERRSTKDDVPRDDDRDKGKLRDKVATGLTLAAGALGLGAFGHTDKEDKDGRESPKRRDEESRRDDAEDRPRPSRRDGEERPRDDDENAPSGDKARKDRDAKDRDAEDAAEDKERNRREAEAKLNGEPAPKDQNSSSDESKPRRRRRASSAFKPNDTASLMALKEQLKAKEESDKENESKAASRDRSVERRQPSPSTKADDAEGTARSSKEDLRGREAASSATDEKQVRVVSPPRDKDDKKPIKGILKQPKSQFPEEPNPVREGVAPHKDDKTKGNVPPGARWTKISRKLVNPDALTIGKERFEVRDNFVIVLRVLNKEEIEAYTAATAQLRGGLLPFPFSLLFTFPVRRSPFVAVPPTP